MAKPEIVAARIAGSTSTFETELSSASAAAAAISDYQAALAAALANPGDYLLLIDLIVKAARAANEPNVP